MNNKSRSDLAMLDRIAALQKLCEEQKAKIEKLLQVCDCDESKSAGVTIVGGRHPRCGKIYVGSRVKELEAKIEEQKGEIERLISATMLTRTDDDGNSETYPIDRVIGLQEIEISGLKSQLATQTERVQTLEKELEALRKKEGFN